MKYLNYIFSIIFFLALVFLGYSIFNSEKSINKEIMIEKTDLMEKAKEDAMIKEFEILAGNQAKLYEFNEVKYETAKSSKNLIILYFYANWCSICREEFPKMQSAFDELAQDNVVGFKVNFKDDQTSEAEKLLASEFGVAYQHTKVFIKDGNQILKAPDSWSKEKYLEEINKVV